MRINNKGNDMTIKEEIMMGIEIVVTISIMLGTLWLGLSGYAALVNSNLK